jgi:hypothetical protein
MAHPKRARMQTLLDGGNFIFLIEFCTGPPDNVFFMKTAFSAALSGVGVARLRNSQLYGLITVKIPINY